MIENETPKKISPSQQKGIAALLTTGSLLAAAEEAGVARGTMYRWLKDPAFTEALRAAEAEAIQALSRSLAGLGEAAAAAFRDALDPGQKISVRLRAAEALTDRLLKIRELVNLEARLAEMERVYAQYVSQD
ncbi:MAG: hypothetical protein KDE46_07070 [Caldilineaceae bacterium]|nr:hypothetical protein [Caldilineaceae bacterium]